MRRCQRGSGIMIGVVLPLAVLCLFAFASLGVGVAGVQLYHRGQAARDDAFACTTAAQYLRGKLQAVHSAADVTVRQEGVGDVLVLRAAIGGESYETRIFLCDGQLMECFVSAAQGFDPLAAVPIVSLQGFRVQLGTDGMLSAALESAGGEQLCMEYWLATGEGHE